MSSYKRYLDPYDASEGSDSPEPPKKRQLSRRLCIICDSEKAINQFPKWRRVSFHDHGSNTCRPCFLRHVEVQIDTRNWDEVSCPECNVVLAFHEVKNMTNKDYFDKYEQASLRAALANDPDYRHCLSTTCESGQLHPGGTDEPIFRCQECGHKHCVACEALWHEDETCNEYQQRLEDERSVENKLSEETVVETSKPCPQCRCPIEKNNGCDHMTCEQYGDVMCEKGIDGYDRFQMSLRVLLALLCRISQYYSKRQPRTQPSLQMVSLFAAYQ